MIHYGVSKAAQIAVARGIADGDRESWEILARIAGEHYREHTTCEGGTPQHERSYLGRKTPNLEACEGQAGSSRKSGLPLLVSRL